MVKEKRMFMNFDKDMGPDVEVIRGPTFDPVRYVEGATHVTRLEVDQT